jgi:hypothetical protein
MGMRKESEKMVYPSVRPKGGNQKIRQQKARSKDSDGETAHHQAVDEQNREKAA